MIGRSCINSGPHGGSGTKASWNPGLPKTGARRRGTQYQNIYRSDVGTFTDYSSLCNNAGISYPLRAQPGRRARHSKGCEKVAERETRQVEARCEGARAEEGQTGCLVRPIPKAEGVRFDVLGRLTSSRSEFYMDVFGAIGLGGLIE